MKYRQTKDEISKAILRSTTWAEACRALGRNDRGGNQVYLKRKAILLGIDFFHFKGKQWSRNKSFNKIPIESYLSNDKYITSHKLRKKLVLEGLKKEVCEICGICEWMGKKAPLELDHKDSNRFNNNLDNLQIVCPNCHALETLSRKTNSLDGETGSTRKS